MKILKSPMTDFFYAVGDNYKPRDKKFDVTPDIEAIIRHAKCEERARCATVAYNWARRSWGTPEFNIIDLREALDPK